jgi:hypothetical protein
LFFNFNYNDSLLYKMSNYKNLINTSLNSFILKKNCFNFIKVDTFKESILKKKKILFKYFFKNKIIKLFYNLSFRTYNFFFKYTNTNFFFSFYQERKILNIFFNKKSILNLKYIPNNSIINSFFKSKFQNVIYITNLIRLFFFIDDVYYTVPINYSIVSNFKYKVFFFISAGFGGYKKKFRRNAYRTKKVLETFKKYYVPFHFRRKMDFFYLIINGISSNFYKFFKHIRTFFFKKYKKIRALHYGVSNYYSSLRRLIHKTIDDHLTKYKLNTSILFFIRDINNKYNTIKIKNEHALKLKDKILFYNGLCFFFYNSIIFFKQLYKSLLFEILFLFLFKLFFLNKLTFNIFNFISQTNF